MHEARSGHSRAVGDGGPDCGHWRRSSQAAEGELIELRRGSKRPDWKQGHRSSNKKLKQTRTG